MELYVAVDDYCVSKLVIAASVAGLELPVKKGMTHADLLQIDGGAKSIVLKTSAGTTITQHVAMLRHIAECAPIAQLTGAAAFDSSQVDQWLDFSWGELGT